MKVRRLHRLPYSIVGIALPAACLHGCHRSDPARVTADVPLPIPAVSYITGAFDTYPLVAFSEPRHGASGTREFLASLVRQPAFAGKVNDIVVECGNARYQAVMDRYIAGEEVPRDDLKRVWENTTIVTGVWSAPMYEAVFSDIRSVNKTLPPKLRFRVLLGDPPIDWSLIRGPADEDMNDWRDAHFAWIVDEQVMKKGRRALIWIGGAHISRRVRFPESLIHLLDRRFPGKTHVVLAVDPRDIEPSLSARLGTSPLLAAARVQDTWLGRSDASAIGLHLSTGSVQENVDAVMLWDSFSHGADETPRFDAQSPFGVELRRRQRLSETTVTFRGGKIRFETDRVSLTSESEPVLKAVLAELQRDGGLELVVKAFADARERNVGPLSLARAQLIVNWLTARGIAPQRLIAKGCGSGRALWVGSTEEERAANRRAELVRASRWADCAPPIAFNFH
jgi:outer membrane protein OmpA-like peptidoglycan-associated protein